ncbi:MAG TPA: DNA repair protein RecN [Gammaproteobacteria bacterium]|nr:DNA repair protein RecN [Gammaproteobacteria bacterium]
MLTHIHIRDFVIVDELDLELERGMTALTGETGAGKSILVDALGLVLGDRGDSSVIRHQAERAEISAAFELAEHPDARAWLQERDLDADGECQLRRIITREGRSRGYINGRPTPIQSLKELGNLLVDIHGQHEHQSLLRRDIQRQLLDDFGGLAQNVRAVSDAYRHWRRRRDELETLQNAEQDRSSRLDLLRFQARELEALALQESEYAELEEEHARLANAGRLLETCRQAVDTLYDSDEGSAHSLLSHAAGELAPLADIDPHLAGARELLDGAVIQLQEGVDELRGYLDRLDLDPARLQWVEDRIGDIHQLARKHRCEPADLPDLLERLRHELHTLEHADEHLVELRQAVDRATADYRRAAESLSRERHKAADKLNARVTEVMQGLGMPGGRFEVAVQRPSGERFTATGLDQIEFQVAANPGQPVMPLGKVASGGELSRISLAIQVIAAGSNHVPSLVFDEVDTGVGGGVAEVVGRKLRTLGDSHQVLCVTHLPQVAAQAHHHLQVSKLAGDESTRTRIRSLNGEERTDELARMLGGIEITASTRTHAREMIEQAQQPQTRKRPPKARRRKADG